MLESEILTGLISAQTIKILCYGFSYAYTRNNNGLTELLTRD